MAHALGPPHFPGKRLVIISLACLALGFLGVSFTPFGTAKGPSSAALASSLEQQATISFSADGKTISVGYQENRWVFNRPVFDNEPPLVSGNVYWVATNGDDNNAGTVQAPFKTINHAIDQAGPGDIVYVHAGTYVENLYITKTGQGNEPIIISCAPGELGKVTITPSAAWVAAHPDGSVVEVANNAQYVWINGFVIQGPKGRPEAPASEHFSANGITWSNGAGFGCRATNNVVYANVHCGLKEMGHGGSNILMEANVIFNNGTTSLDHGIYCPANDCNIDGNIIFDNASWGIHAYTAPQRLHIYRNIVTGNGGGLVLGGASCELYNNVFAYNQFIGLLYFRGLCTNNIVKNNIVAFNSYADEGYDNGGGLLGDPANNMDDYNLFFPGTPAPQIFAGAHEVQSDPQFTNATLGDFRPAAGSPCIGSGTDVGLPFQGERPNLGAF